MDLEDLEPRKKPVALKDLSGWSVADLNAYIERLQAEIERARAVIQSKQSHRAGAEALFRK